MSEKDLVVHIPLNAEEKKKYFEVVDKSKGNKSVVSKDAFMDAINKLHKKLYKPGDILANFNTEVNG